MLQSSQIFISHFDSAVVDINRLVMLDCGTIGLKRRKPIYFHSIVAHKANVCSALMVEMADAELQVGLSTLDEEYALRIISVVMLGSSPKNSM